MDSCPAKTQSSWRLFVLFEALRENMTKLLLLIVSIITQIMEEMALFKGRNYL
jgi:hypothetical protein